MYCGRFGEHGGFQGLLDRFKSGKPLSIPVVFALIKPFGYCFELLTVHTITTYFLPIIVRILVYFVYDDVIRHHSRSLYELGNDTRGFEKLNRRRTET